MRQAGVERLRSRTSLVGRVGVPVLVCPLVIVSEWDSEVLVCGGGWVRVVGVELPPISGVCVDSMMLADCVFVLSRFVPVSGNRELNGDVYYCTRLRSKQTHLTPIVSPIARYIDRRVPA
jgi:hypothetical protein